MPVAPSFEADHEFGIIESSAGGGRINTGRVDT